MTGLMLAFIILQNKERGIISYEEMDSIKELFKDGTLKIEEVREAQEDLYKKVEANTIDAKQYIMTNDRLEGIFYTFATIGKGGVA